MNYGASGRVVIDLDPAFKARLYETLKARGMNMKQWFIEQAETFCDDFYEPKLFGEDTKSPLSSGAKTETPNNSNGNS